MPIYEYKCDACGQVFELKQSFSDAPLTLHEGCGGAVERLISAPALQFKGSGWYITDYARGGSAAEKAKNGSDSATSDTKTSDKKTSDKPASSTPSTTSSSSTSSETKK